MGDSIDVLSEADAMGFDFRVDGDRLLVCPCDNLPPELRAKIRQHKAVILAFLRQLAKRPGPAPPAAPQRTPDAIGDPPVNDAERHAERILARSPRPAKPCDKDKPVCKCGSTTWRDVSIHEGRSVRRDCRRCGRFVCFAVWYGIYQLQNVS